MQRPADATLEIRPRHLVGVACLMSVIAACDPPEVAPAPPPGVSGVIDIEPPGRAPIFQVPEDPSLLPRAAAEQGPSWQHRPSATHLEGTVVHAVTGEPVAGASLWAGERRLGPIGRDGRFSTPIIDGSLTIRAPLFHPQRIDPTPGAAATIPLTPNGRWPMLGGTPRRHGATPLTGAMSTAPGVKWTWDLAQGGLLRGIWVADLDQDGVEEWLTVEGERVIARRGDGRLMWRSHGPAGREVGTVIGIADLDGDGQVEVVAGNAPAEGSAGMYRVGRLTVLDGQTGAAAYSASLFDVYTGHGNAVDIRPDYATIADMDGDPGLEIVVSSKYSHEFRVYDFSDGVAAGRLAWRGDWEGYRNYITVAVGDVDGDGQREIVGATTGRLVLLNAEGARYTPPLSDRNLTVTANLFLRDLDHDGDDEIISLSYNPFALAVYDARPEGIEALYTLDLPGIATVVEGSVSDVDGDGDWEIVYTRGPTTHVRDLLTGEEEYAGERRLLRGVADLTGDGVPEIILLRNKTAFEVLSGPDYGVLAELPELGSSRYKHPRHLRWSTTHHERARPDPHSVYRTALPSVAVGDVDGDGIAEIVGRARRSAALIAVDVSGPAPVEKWRHAIDADAHFYVPAEGIADLDGDGAIETIVHLSDGEVRVLDERGEARFSMQTVERLVRPLVADLDGDGVNEVILSTRDPLSNGGDLRPLEVVGHGPEGLMRRPFAFTGSLLHERGNPPVTADLDGDGASEIVGVAVVSEAGQTEYRVVALDGAGAVVWQTEPLAGRVEHLTVGEFDGDGLPDLYIALVSGPHFALAGRDGQRLWSADTAGGRYVPTSVDLSGDGIDDLAMVGGNDHFFGYSGADGAVLFDVVHQALCNSGTLMAADLDGDGRSELITSGNYGLVVASDAGELVWDGMQTEGNKWFYGAVVDTDDDGRLDVVHPSHHGVHVTDADGVSRWSFGAMPRKATTSVVAADVDSDGRDEVVVGMDGVLYALEKADGAVQWSVDLGARLGEPVVADLDGDGLAEILVAAAGRLWVLGPTAAPDVRIEAVDLRLSRDRPRAGEAVEVHARVRNVGGAPAERVILRFTADEAPFSIERVTIPPGGSVALTREWIAEPGVAAVAVTVDSPEDARGDDNAARRPIQVRGDQP